MPPDETLRRLQEIFLAAAIGGRALPGAEAPVRMPDLPMILAGPVILLAEENVAGALEPAALPRPLRIVGEAELRAEVAARGTVAFLRFQPAERQGDTVWLTLQARMATNQESASSLALGGVRAGFRSEGGAWRVIEEPIAFAT